MTGRLALALLAVAAAACTDRRTVGQPSFSVVNQTLDLSGRNQVDILFMIDDSNSETGQQAFQSDFTELFSRIRGLASAGATASYHIGVIDSDMGAAGNLQACAKPGGDGGRLLTGPSSHRAIRRPPTARGSRSPSRSSTTTRPPASATPARSRSPTPFSAHRVVGDQGCGFEAQFEAIHQALTPGVNPGFLRDDALLVVIMLTDEDDCSAPPDTTLFANTTDAAAKWGVLQSFRCTQWGIACNGKPLDGNVLAPTSDCVPVDGGPLYDVSRYIGLFRPGGVKATADNLILAAIAAPPSPFGVTLTMPCATQATTAACPTSITRASTRATGRTPAIRACASPPSPTPCPARSTRRSATPTTATSWTPSPTS